MVMAVLDIKIDFPFWTEAYLAYNNILLSFILLLWQNNPVSLNTGVQTFTAAYS